MTPADFQDRFGPNQKVLRHYLRARWPHEHNSRWFLDDGRILDALRHFNIPASSYGPAVPQVQNASPASHFISSCQGLLQPAVPPSITASASQITGILTTFSNAQPPSEFPMDKFAARSAGMYSWWADDAGRQLLGEPFGTTLPPLIYVGQAGATRWPSGSRSGATLGSRIGKQHINGNARSSTFRLTISALLLAPLRLTLDADGKLEAASNGLVSRWIAEHLRVAIAPFHDRDLLGAIEAALVSTLDPPLNLDHCYPTSARNRLSRLRKEITHR